MATAHDFHLGAKTEHAQGDLIDTTHQQSASTKASDDARCATDSAQEKGQEGKESAGNIFQQAGGALKNAVGETVHEVKSTLERVDNPAKVTVED